MEFDDETYELIQRLARERGTTPEQVVAEAVRAYVTGENAAQ